MTAHPNRVVYEGVLDLRNNTCHEQANFIFLSEYPWGPPHSGWNNIVGTFRENS